MKIYLARHGQTNYNVLGLCNADPKVDVHLTPAGIEQSEDLADKLRQVPFDRIFVSELRRTQQTADIVNKSHAVTVEVDARLNDGRSGFESKPFAEYEKALSGVADKWSARFNGGESMEDIKQRVAAFIDDLRTKKYDAVLIVTSLWVIQAMLAVARGISNDEAWSIEPPQGDYLEL